MTGLRGTGFGRLWAANAVSNVGDGVTVAAGPLLVASLTDDPALISLAVFARRRGPSGPACVRRSPRGCAGSGGTGCGGCWRCRCA